MRFHAPAPIGVMFPRPRRPLVARLVAAAVLGVMLAVTIAGVVLYVCGMRWFMVETPSMGTAAPVGTLVITAPTPFTAVHVGEVIAFRPPTEPQHVYTHRVAAITPTGVETRGDINGATDGWRLTKQDLIGRAVALIPGVGFLLRAVPMLIAGNAVVWLITRTSRVPAQRAALRNIGFHLVAALPSFVLHPFVQILVLQTQAAGSHIRAAVVSTGLLPVRVSASSGQHLDLIDGQVGTLSLPTTAGGYHLTANLDLTTPELLLLIAICLIPMVVTFVVGLPEGPSENAPARRVVSRRDRDRDRRRGSLISET